MRTTGYLGLLGALLLLAWGAGVVIAAQGSGCADGEYHTPAFGPWMLHCNGDCPNDDRCVPLQRPVTGEGVPPGTKSHRCVCDANAYEIEPGVWAPSPTWYDDTTMSKCRFRVVIVPPLPPATARYIFFCDKVTCEIDCSQAQRGIINQEYYCDCTE